MGHDVVTALLECRAVLATSEMSVRPSVKRVHCGKTEGSSARFFYTIRKII